MRALGILTMTVLGISTTSYAQSTPQNCTQAIAGVYYAGQVMGAAEEKFQNVNLRSVTAESEQERARLQPEWDKANSDKEVAMRAAIEAFRQTRSLCQTKN
jgi:hypothetical protein